jgi:RNA recognition motif-containing protein
MTTSTAGSGGRAGYAPGLNKYPYTYQMPPTYSTPSVRGYSTSPPSNYAPNYSATTTSSATAGKFRAANDATTIFLSGLPRDQSETELRSTLRAHGHLVYLEIHPDRRKLGRGKGTARARFQTPLQALNAIRGLDGLRLGGRKISAKQAKDVDTLSMRSSRTVPDNRAVTRPVSEGKRNRGKAHRPIASAQVDTSNIDPTSNTGPLVVNGATNSTSWRNSRDEPNESDDNSEESSQESSEESSDEDEEEENYNKNHGMFAPIHISEVYHS